MLSLITKADVVSASARFRMGTLLPWSDIAPVPRDRASDMAAVKRPAAESAVTRQRPQARSGAVRFGADAHVADQAKSALHQPTSQKFAYLKTRIAAVGGGAMGSHPARDPV